MVFLITITEVKNIYDDEATFLDLIIKVKNEVFHTSLYDAFPINNVNFPNLSSNIPKKTSYVCLFLKLSDIAMLVWNTETLLFIQEIE